MRWRSGRMGAWRREYSMYTERIDNEYKDNRIKKKKPSESWDDVWTKTSRSWKEQRKKQFKSLYAKPQKEEITPMMWTKVICVKSGLEGYTIGEAYTVIGSGRCWLDPHEKVVWVTCDDYPDTKDEDYGWAFDVPMFNNYFKQY